MAIETGTNFHVKTNLPLDSRSVAKTAAERDAIPEGERYEGMRVYVEDEHKLYTARHYTGGGEDQWLWIGSPRLFYAGRVYPSAVMLNSNIYKYGKAGMTLVADASGDITNPVTAEKILSLSRDDILILKKDVTEDAVTTVFTGEEAFREYFDIIPCRYEELAARISSTVGAYTWHMDTDKVYGKDGRAIGSLKSCMTAEMTGTWFFARTSAASTGSAQYPSGYTINGANGYLSLGDFVIWTGESLVHVSTYEAKSSALKNGDGRYSPRGGVDGLMSSTDKAYLTDLIDQHWGRGYLPVYTTPEPAEGWQTNWLFDDGWYLGGIKKDCGGHPPVIRDNHTSWAVLVLNRMATDAESLNRNHRLQIAWDLVNSKVYMRRGWMSTNTWADKWDEVGADRINQFGVDPQTGAWPNWLTDIGIYKIKSWASGAGNLPPTAADSDPADRWIIVTTVGAKDATAATARTQYAIRTDNRAVYTRSNPGYSGTGSLTASGIMSGWTSVMDGVSSPVTYTLVKDGSKIRLKGSDGSETSVTDTDTTYTISRDGTSLTIESSNGEFTGLPNAFVPTDGNEGDYLVRDRNGFGQWNTLGPATDKILGLMSPADKKKLDAADGHTHDNKAALDLVSSDSWGGAIGSGASVSYGGGAVGSTAKVTDGGGAVGYDADAANGGAVGNVARETGGGGAIGYYAQAGEGFSGGNRAQVKITDGKYIDAIQLGKGTNNNPLTLQVYDYQVTASTKSMAGDSGHIWLKDVGELSGLKTSDRSSIVAAINELAAKIAALS